MWELIDFINNKIFYKTIISSDYAKEQSKKQKYIGKPVPKLNKQKLKKLKKLAINQPDSKE